MQELSLEHLVVRIGIALGLGLLVGLQRERSDATIAGLRTFALVTVFGGIAAVLSVEFGGWVLAAAFLTVATMVVMGNVAKLRAGFRDPGITTEVAVLLMFGLGAFLVIGPLELGIAAGGTVAVLLHAKDRLQRLVDHMGDQDVTAIMRFVLLTLVILPVLPDRTFDPLGVLNPRQIWLMVVLIVGIGLGGYVTYKLLGDRAGTALAGLLGGMISSTATTVSYARRSRFGDGPSEFAAVIILIASSVVFVRVLVEIAVVAPGSLSVAAPPLLLLLAGFVFLSVVAWSRRHAGALGMPEQGNPTELSSALAFGGLYGVILLATAAGQEWFGSEGLYLIALISGLANTDAITLSTAHLTQEGRLEPSTLWRVVTVAVISNLLFKLGIARFLGGRMLFRRLLPFYAAGILGAIVLIVGWPDR